MTDDRSRGVHLDDKHLVFVFMAAFVVAVVVFLCGVLVGRGVPFGRAAAGDGAMMTPAQVVSDGGADSVGGEAPPADQGAKPGSPLSYPERLGQTPPAERLKAPADSAPPQPPAEAVLPEAGEPVGTPADGTAGSGEWTVQVLATKKRSEADAALKDLKVKGFDARMSVPEIRDQHGAYRVRVGAFPTQKEADALAQRIARETRYKQLWVTR